MTCVQLGFQNLLPKRKVKEGREEGNEGNLQKDFQKVFEKAYVTSLGEVGCTSAEKVYCLNLLTLQTHFKTQNSFSLFTNQNLVSLFLSLFIFLFFHFIFDFTAQAFIN